MKSFATNYSGGTGNMSHKHDISTTDYGNYSSNNINQYFIDYYEIRNDTNSTNNALSSYSDLNIMNNIYSSSSSNNNYNNSNINTTTTINDNCNTTYYSSGDLYALANFVITVNYYYVPILVSTGSIGNIFSIIVFFKKKLRKLSSSYYLAALAISDTCFLFEVLVSWLSKYFGVIPLRYELICKFQIFFTSLSWFCSCWFVAAFTFERFIAVSYPLKRQTMCTVRRAKIVLLSLTIVGFIHCVPFWIVSESQYSEQDKKYFCDYKPQYANIMKILNYWDSFFVFAVPFTLIAILNTRTAFTARKFANERRSMTMQKRKGTLTKASITSNSNATSSLTHRHSKRQNSSSSHHSGENYHLHHHGFTMRKHSAKQKSSNSTHTKVTKMLLVVSTVFVCLNLPSCLMRIKAYHEVWTNKCVKYTTIQLQYIFEPFFITNFGINFVLYCVSGQNFRKEVLSMFRRRSLAQREGTTTQVTDCEVRQKAIKFPKQTNLAAMVDLSATVTEYCRASGGGNGTSSRRRQLSCWHELREL